MVHRNIPPTTPPMAAGTATVAVMASAALAATTGHVVAFVADAGLRRDDFDQGCLMLHYLEQTSLGIAG